MLRLLMIPTGGGINCREERLIIACEDVDDIEL